MKIKRDDDKNQLSFSFKPILVKFTSDHCAPCQALSPILDNLAQKYEGKIHYLKVDVDQNREMAERYNVRGLPFTAIIRNGKMLAALIGKRPEAKYVELIETAI